MEIARYLPLKDTLTYATLANDAVYYATAELNF